MVLWWNKEEGEGWFAGLMFLTTNEHELMQADQSAASAQGRSSRVNVANSRLRCFSDI